MQMNRITHFSLLFVVLFMISCTSEEYTSAKLYLQQNEYEKAEKFLIKAMVVEPDNPEIPFQLGHYIYGRSGRWAEMNEAFDKIIGTEPRLKETPFAFGGNMVIHQNLFTAVPFDPKISRGEDMDFLFLLVWGLVLYRRLLSKILIIIDYGGVVLKRFFICCRIPFIHIRGNAI